MKQSRIRKPKKADLLMIVFLLTVGLAGSIWLWKREPGQYVWIRQQDSSERYVLSEDREILLEGSGGQENRIVIQDGEVYMEEASCPDQICVKHAPISGQGEMIICLPNQVYVQIEDGTEPETDN